MLAHGCWCGMNSTGRRPKAIVLFSGGLDSRLTAALLKRSGVELQGLLFSGAFFDNAAARKSAADIGMPLTVLEFTSTLARLLTDNGTAERTSPPCTACRTAMLAAAGRLMREEGCDFIATGEVLGQRLPVQSAEGLARSAARSGFADFIVRPLSAKRLPAPPVIHRGIVPPECLLDLGGRGWKTQLRLAASLGVLHAGPLRSTDCRLRNDHFMRRVMDLADHDGLGGVHNLELLHVGRHFRLSPHVKLVVGRNAEENAFIEGNAQLYDLLLRVENSPGPTGTLPYLATPTDLDLAARICARYTNHGGDKVCVRVRSPRNTRTISVTPADSAVLEKYRI